MNISPGPSPAGTPGRAAVDKPSIRAYLLWAAPFVLAIIGYCTWQVSHAPQGNFDAWVIGGWLINYGGGFIRRGLSGTVILEFARFSGIGPASLVYAIVLVLFVGWTLLFFINLAAFRSLRVIGLGLFSPLILFFDGTSDALLRKENLFFFLIAWTSIARSADTRRWQLTVALAPLLILCHEAIFAWMPALVAIVMVRKPSLKLVCWLVLSSGALLLACILFHGNAAQARQICSIVNGFDQTATFAYCRGAIAALGDHAQRFVQHRELADEAEQAMLCLALYIAPFVLYLGERLADRRHRVILAAGFVATTALALPLFVVATDVGRWLRAIFICSATVAAACCFQENRVGSAARAIDPDRQRLRALLLYELMVMTIFIGVSDVNGPYFGFAHSLWQRGASWL